MAAETECSLPKPQTCASSGATFMTTRLGVVASNGSLLLLSNNTNIHNNNPLDGLDVLGNSTADVKATTIQNNGSPGFRMAILQA